VELSISQLLTAYENGKLTRRSLLQALALVSVSSSAASAAGFQGTTINHVTLNVTDLQSSSDFYQNAFGAVAQKHDGYVMVPFGATALVLKPGSPAGRVDHFAIGVDRFNEAAVTADLKARGAGPYKDGADLRVKDPDGFSVQLSGNA
jgi:catechol 2,3-dioxygenase-like lactoylglutathione lyase family enzyme